MRVKIKSNNQTLFEKLYIIEISAITGKILILGGVIFLCIVMKWQYQFNEKEFRIFSKDSYFYLQDCTKRVK